MADMGLSIVAKLFDLVSGPSKVIQANLAGIGAAAKGASAATTAAAATTTAAVGTMNTAIAGSVAAMSRLKVVAAGTAAFGVGAMFMAMNRGTKEAMAYDAAMTNVRKVMDKTRQEFKPYEQALYNLTNRFPVSFEDAAESFRYSSRLNQDLDFMTRYAEISLKAQKSFDMTAEAAAESTKNLLNLFSGETNLKGLNTVGETLDVINMLDNRYKGATSKNILKFVTRAGGGAQLFGMSPQDLAAFAAYFQILGESSDRVSTSFAKGLAVLNKGGASKSKDVQRAIKVLGFKDQKSFHKAMAGAGTEGVIKLLDAVIKRPQADRGVLLRSIFGEFPGRYFERLVANPKILQNLKDFINGARDAETAAGSLGAEAEMAFGALEERQKVAENRWRNMWARWGMPMARLKTQFQELMSLIPLGLEKLPDLFGKNFNLNLPNLGDIAAAFTTLSVALTTIFAAANWATAGFAMSALVASLTAAVAPAMAVAAALAGIYWLWTNWDNIGVWLDERLDAILDKIEEIKEKVSTQGLGKTILDELAEAAYSLSGALGEVIRLYSQVLDLFQKKSGMEDEGKLSWMDRLTRAWERLKSVAEAARDAMRWIWQNTFGSSPANAAEGTSSGPASGPAPGGGLAWALSQQAQDGGLGQSRPNVKILGGTSVQEFVVPVPPPHVEVKAGPHARVQVQVEVLEMTGSVVSTTETSSQLNGAMIDGVK